MNINIRNIINNDISGEDVNIVIEANKQNKFVKKIVDYINLYENKRITLTSENKLKSVLINDILYFYSKNKFNYCKTKQYDFKIKNKLYELEKINTNFLRISKGCVINIKNVKEINIINNERITIYFYNGFAKRVSRRKAKNVLNNLKERDNIVIK